MTSSPPAQGSSADLDSDESLTRPGPPLEDEFDVLVLSPHLDDAVFSCGASLVEWGAAGRRVLVVTPFAGCPHRDLSPFAQELHDLWGLGDAAEVLATRRAEDAEALKSLGVVWRHGDLLDAIYRSDGDDRWLYPDLAALRGRGNDDPVETELVRLFRSLPSAKKILSPLGVGGHVDHRLVNRASRACFRRRLSFYEDYPYASSARSRMKAHPWLTTKSGHLWKKRVRRIKPRAAAAKLFAAEMYRSQLIGELADGGLRSRLSGFMEARGGECFWEPR